jgi:SAM-dependent methyltransferase
MSAQHAPYDPHWVADFYNKYGDREWERLMATPVDRVSLAIHTHYLRRFIQPGSRVLEIGPGPGRFTQILAELGCNVSVADISPGQLELHRNKALELGFEAAVEERRCLDICNLDAYADCSFDAVLAYGGPLSYVFDRAEQALRECTRVCRPGGHVLASVMSLWGSCHRFLPQVLEMPVEANQRITTSGDLTPRTWDQVTHRCHMFRSGELRALVERIPLTVRALSASGFLVLTWSEKLQDLDPQSAAWKELLRMELEACAGEGGTDAGTHIIVVAERP